VIGSGGKDNAFKHIAKNLSVTIDHIVIAGDGFTSAMQ
jgi:hypothetical protein